MVVIRISNFEGSRAFIECISRTHQSQAHLTSWSVCLVLHRLKSWSNGVATVGYIRLSATHLLGATTGRGLAESGCSPSLARLIESRLQAALKKLEAAQAQLRAGGRAVRQILKENFLDSSIDTQRRVSARIDEAVTHARRALTGQITIECSEAADCCGGSPACLMPERGLDRIFLCIPRLRQEQEGAARHEQILIHELFHRSGLRGPQMHALEFGDIDCARKNDKNDAIRTQAKAGTNLLEVVDVHVRAVWCLAALVGI